MKDMFVMNFRAGYYDPVNDRWVEPEIPNEAITSQDGFPGQGMPLLWLLNANEGALRWVSHPLGDIPGKIVNFLYGYAYIRGVYAAVVVPSKDDRPELAWTLGPIWDGYRWVQINGEWKLVCDLPLAPVIEVCVSTVKETVNSWNRVGYNYDLSHALACVIAHELGHTILWDVDHNPAIQDGQDPMSILTNGDSGHHVYQQHRMHCFMWPYFPPGFVPDLDGDGNLESLPFPNLPTDFCDSYPGCQSLWHLNPK